MHGTHAQSYSSLRHETIIIIFAVVALRCEQKGHSHDSGPQVDGQGRIQDLQ